MLSGLQKSPVEIAALCDTYGGAINKVASDATAFVHRGTTKYSIQYFKEWAESGRFRCQHRGNADAVYVDAAVSFPVDAYVNYCDLDLGEGYAKAYWGDNLPRLMKIKAQVDPKNIFRHAQSVPLS